MILVYAWSTRSLDPLIYCSIRAASCENLYNRKEYEQIQINIVMYTHRTYGRIFQNLQISILNITQTWEYREQLQLAAHCAHTSQSGSRHHQQTALTKNIKE